MMHISDTLIQAVSSAMKPFLPALFRCPATQTAKGLSSTQRAGERATIETLRDRGEEAHGVTVCRDNKGDLLKYFFFKGLVFLFTFFVFVFIIIITIYDQFC